MSRSKTEQLTQVVLSVFQLNGALIDWGDQFVAGESLTSARWQMLGALALAEGTLTAPQVAKTMGVTRQGAQKQLNLLLESGLVDASPNPLHKRSPRYALTPRGQALFAAIDQRWKAHAARLADRFSTDDLRVAASVLAALLESHHRKESTDET